jgi:TPP-dependent trihydroxycyclohexane-1,2-dione (THcHDO) dehydratase
MSKHTPGPWTVAADPDSENDVYYAVFAEDEISDARFEDDFIAVTNLNHANNEANARLIASAPELLEALRTALKGWEVEFEYLAKRTPEWVTQARAAIAKATGGNNV